MVKWVRLVCYATFLALMAGTLLMIQEEIYLRQLYRPTDVFMTKSSTPANRSLSTQQLTRTAIPSTDGASYNSNNNLPTCRSLMQQPHSPYTDGSFLTRHTIPISWIPRHDGSRELRHSLCELHRYTASEARQCLKGKHLTMIGDSLTRYQFLSLAWFIHKGQYPPHFGRPRVEKQTECIHIDEHGLLTCSPDKGEFGSATNHPNICMEGDWRFGSPKNGDPWRWLMQKVGDKQDGIFDGYMESAAIRTARSKDEHTAENYFYAGPLLDEEDGTAEPSAENLYNRVMLSYWKETGWNTVPRNINGFNFTGCAFTGNCEYPDGLAEELVERGLNEMFDFSQPLPVALSENGTMFTQQHLPPFNITIYNRGLWGPLTKEQTETILPLLYKSAGGDQGRCFFKSTTGRFQSTLEKERHQYVRQTTFANGCGYLDMAHLVEDFNNIPFLHPPPPLQEGAISNAFHERTFVFWDLLHFMPWVYEELNNMLLNVLCNHRTDLNAEPVEVQ